LILLAKVLTLPSLPAGDLAKFFFTSRWHNLNKVLQFQIFFGEKEAENSES